MTIQGIKITAPHDSCDSCGGKKKLCQYEGDVTKIAGYDKLGFKEVMGIWLLCPVCAKKYKLPNPYNGDK